jgi:hypothetical protein
MRKTGVVVLAIMFLLLVLSESFAKGSSSSSFSGSRSFSSSSSSKSSSFGGSSSFGSSKSSTPSVSPSGTQSKSSVSANKSPSATIPKSAPAVVPQSNGNCFWRERAISLTFQEHHQTIIPYDNVLYYEIFG